jgi:hypothetical protein
VSVHLARILAQQYGNLRIKQSIKQVTNTTIVAEALVFDLETNYAVSVEARRSIISKTGQRFSDSLIETNAMATLAIAERNAILKIIPKGIIDRCYNTAFNFANGDLNDEQKLLQARKKAFDFFAEKYAATEEEVLKALGLRAIGQVGKEQIADLRGFMQALKDGELTADELFGKKTAHESSNPLADKVAKKKEATKAPVEPSAPVQESPAPQSDLFK